VRGDATDVPGGLRRAEVCAVGERRQHVAQQWIRELRIGPQRGSESPPPLKPVRTFWPFLGCTPVVQASAEWEQSTKCSQKQVFCGPFSATTKAMEAICHDMPAGIATQPSDEFEAAISGAR